MDRIACYPAKASIDIDYQFSPDYYDVSPILEIDDAVGDRCVVENWGDCILFAYKRNDLDRMERMYQKMHPGTKPIHLVWEGRQSGQDIVEAMVPATFKIGDPIYFNLKNMKVEFDAGE